MWCKRVSAGALAAALAVGSFSSTAHAYCRSRTCSLGKTPEQAEAECPYEDGCINQGARLHWSSRCLRYAVQVDGSALRGVDGDQLADLVAQAFELWKSVECPEGGNPRFEAGFQGFVTCHERESVCAGPSGNVNVVMFHDEAWPYAPNALGITTPTAGLETGVINDADIELNAQAIVDPVDIFPVLAHEVGHFLGLDHSNASGALMSEFFINLGTSGELLTDDDVAGICAIYPPGAALSCNTPDPARDECANPDPETLENCSLGVPRHEESGGCSVGRVGSQRPGTPLVAFGAVLGLVALLRRRARHSSG
jgi:hypothetical protein